MAEAAPDDEVIIDCVAFFMKKARGANSIGRRISFDALLRKAKNAL